uniref:Uncharacterized protein n=1 Tax=Noctiluca scintillans TaxID=2966 RepID=A0A7S1A052_NOCSC|mmetsp:Transcript_25327/g.66370  ORF Transcript_25327/g.66370 Transcript_25327/m.66370 type:complete len:537 (+) Transcript_25327:101-1711(+)
MYPGNVSPEGAEQKRDTLSRTSGPCADRLSLGRDNLERSHALCGSLTALDRHKPRSARGLVSPLRLLPRTDDHESASSSARDPEVVVTCTSLPGAPASGSPAVNLYVGSLHSVAGERQLGGQPSRSPNLLQQRAVPGPGAVLRRAVTVPGNTADNKENGEEQSHPLLKAERVQRLRSSGSPVLLGGVRERRPSNCSAKKGSPLLQPRSLSHSATHDASVDSTPSSAVEPSTALLSVSPVLAAKRTSADELDARLSFLEGTITAQMQYLSEQLVGLGLTQKQATGTSEAKQDSSTNGLNDWGQDKDEVLNSISTLQDEVASLRSLVRSGGVAGSIVSEHDSVVAMHTDFQEKISSMSCEIEAQFRTLREDLQRKEEVSMAMCMEVHAEACRLKEDFRKHETEFHEAQTSVDAIRENLEQQIGSSVGNGPSRDQILMDISSLRSALDDLADKSIGHTARLDDLQRDFLDTAAIDQVRVSVTELQERVEQELVGLGRMECDPGTWASDEVALQSSVEREIVALTRRVDTQCRKVHVHNR